MRGGGGQQTHTRAQMLKRRVATGNYRTAGCGKEGVKPPQTPASVRGSDSPAAVHLGPTDTVVTTYMGLIQTLIYALKVSHAPQKEQ